MQAFNSNKWYRFLASFMALLMFLPLRIVFLPIQQSAAQPSQDAACNLDGNEKVDHGDLLLLDFYLRNKGPDGDFTGDGKTDMLDLYQFYNSWWKEVPFSAPLPPDPSLIAPSLDPTTPTNFHTSTRFLYEGVNRVQTGVSPGTIESERASVLRGMVMTRHGSPMPGVEISVLNHPEFGSTLTRADGWFDIAVNGGGQLTVQYRRPGYLPIQRKVDAPWRDFAFLPDVALIPYDTQVTTIELKPDSPMQVARGSVITDEDGTRRATILFPEGTRAELVTPDGGTQPTDTLNIRITEYTVGPNGPNAMPAELPPTSAYTYCVETSADEALVKINGKDVLLNQPVILYVENFLDFPVGAVVPVGYYDNTNGVWIPSDNGQVIQIQNVVDGKVEIDVDGDEVPDDTESIGSLLITDSERIQLAKLYEEGQSLWRMPIHHLSCHDGNWWGYVPPENAERPNGNGPERKKYIEDDCENEGSSVIQILNQALGENVEITGTPFTLHYQSDRVPGPEMETLNINLTGESVPESLKSIELEVQIAGNIFTESYSPEPNLTVPFRWDYLDTYYRRVQGIQDVMVRIGFTYSGVYTWGTEKIQRAFARFNDPSQAISYSVLNMRSDVTIWKEWTDVMRAWDTRGQGLGGWTLDAHHVYDPQKQVLYRGDGISRENAENISELIITTIAGSGEAISSGDGGSALEAGLLNPFDVVAAPDGSLYIAEIAGSRIRHVNPDGIITTFIGGGDKFWIEVMPITDVGIPATEVKFPVIDNIDLGPDDSLYFTGGIGTGPRMIFRVDRNGIITSVAGNGTYSNFEGDNGDGGLATEAPLSPISVCVGPDGSLYITESWNRIRQVTPDGMIYTIAGGGTNPGDNIPATDAQLKEPHNVALGPDGSLYIVETGNNRIRRVSPDGYITTVAGNSGVQGFYGNPNEIGDGLPATEAFIWQPQDIAISSDGTLYITAWEYVQPLQRSIVARVGGDGIFNVIAGAYPASQFEIFGGDYGPAMQGLFYFPKGIDLDPNGNLYFADYRNNRIRCLGSQLPVNLGDEIVIASKNGEELYVFTSAGQHNRTLNALTGAVLYSFSYNDEGYLTQVVDGYGNTTTIERDENGDPIAIIAPYGQRTELSLDENGYMDTMINPAGETHLFTYHGEGGLLATHTNPRGYTSRFILMTTVCLFAMKILRVVLFPSKEMNSKMDLKCLKLRLREYQPRIEWRLYPQEISGV